MGQQLLPNTPLQINGIQTPLWVLYGHLSRKSLQGLEIGEQILQGQEIGKNGR